MSVVDVDPGARIEDLVAWSGPRGAEVRGPLRALLRDIAAYYADVVRNGERPGAGRDRVRASARAVWAAGTAEDVLRAAVQLLTEQALRRTAEPSALLAASQVVLAECLACAATPRLNRVRQLLNGEPPEPAIRLPAEQYAVVVFRTRRCERAVVAALLSEVDGQLVDGQELLAGRHGDNAVLLVPGGAEQRVRWLLAELGGRLGEPRCAGVAECGPGAVTAGYGQAAHVLALALAAEREPGLYRIDDFLIEYAAMRNPAVSHRLVAIVRPLLGNEPLYETLRAFVRCGHNRSRTARELFIHRTTLDYRIRRIAVLTGHDPTSGNGGQVLAAAVTLFELGGLP